MQSLTKQFEELRLRIESAMARLDIAGDVQRVEQLEAQMAKPDFWDDPVAAATISQEVATLKTQAESWQHLYNDAKVAGELAALNDASMQADLQANLEKLQAQYGAKEFELKLSGPHDREGAILSITAGAGGTDAQDWAEMLLRMYLRFVEAQGWQAEVVDRSDGEEAGIKSVTMEISGAYAYGKLKAERGVHRLVRLSPFNSDNLRQTSFALVDVVPRLTHPEQFEIDEKELRVDVFRSGGHGGQSVNTTDSAVRITHLPTGTVVAIQNERSQLQNKEKALAILKARLTVMMLEQQAEELSKLRGAQKSAEWGSQIRSYVLHPYTKVKDHRTGHETAAAQEVLDGDLEPFIDAYLEKQATR
jgi:peptide chain release factor 2